MLVLARRRDESIMIGDDIKVMVVGYKNRNGELEIRLGIEAPEGIEVWREELYWAKKNQRQRTAEADRGGTPAGE